MNIDAFNQAKDAIRLERGCGKARMGCSQRDLQNELALRFLFACPGSALRLHHTPNGRFALFSSQSNVT